MTSPGLHEFDAVFHSAPRITIMTRLVIHRKIRFSVLQEMTGLTAGNLANHLAVLETAGHVRQEKRAEMVSAPKIIHILPFGEEKFRAYVNAMRTLFSDLARPGPTVADAPGRT